MESKKTTFLLSITLIIILILLFLKPCGILEKFQQRFQRPVAIEQTEEIIAEDEVPVKAPSPKVRVVTKQSSVSKTQDKKTVEPVPAQKSVKEESPVYSNKSGFKPFYIYSEIGDKNNHYYPSGMMGNVGAININQAWEKDNKFGKTCVRITYNALKAGTAWAGVYWQEPANNWGDKGYGFNLTGSERLSFWARGENGGEEITNFIIGGIQGKDSEDSDSRAIGPIELTKEWKQYTIHLTGADLNNVIGGFGFTITRDGNPNGAVFYLDNVVYE
ncbi:hypothetical protein [Endomicrobium proavitum]|uniref:Uncharacterized protein n=1 Tax=Endomicrobium proavitum TaxID=1408281 RepID=A0A0G3WKL3_9BACT|nr:hypothetical protein [Endomicrobium proavitum]AKL97994.1 hypothetical protein Epro_0615 [Endomicrobium proavitum]